MSRNNNNNNNKNKNTVSEQKYCKVCQDAGKSEAEFRSHFTRESRDPNSKVTCPLLLALECRYCYKNGHTVKYCPIIKEREKQNKREEASYRNYEMGKKASKPIEKTKQAPRNAFTCLNCDSDDEDTKVTHKKLTEEFPELVKANITAPNKNNNYAAALATAVPEPKVVKSVPIPISLSKTEVQVTKKVEVPIIKKSSMLSWADEESDSSDDEEEEEEEYNSHINSKNTMVNGYDSDW
jgi:hypothetical protein